MRHNEMDGRGSRPQLPPDRVQELNSVARSYLAEQITDAELERVVAAVSRDARECGMKAEEVIVMCKEIWRGLPAESLGAERSTRTRKLERIVQICIDGYFADV